MHEGVTVMEAASQDNWHTFDGRLELLRNIVGTLGTIDERRWARGLHL